MKKLMILLLVFALVASFCACGEVKNAELPEDLSSVLDAQSADVGQGISSKKETVLSKEQSSKSESKKTTTAKTEERKITFKNTLPKAYFSSKDANVRYTDMVNLKDGGFAVCGHRDLEDYPQSLIRFYDKNNKLLKEFTSATGNGFEKMAVCSDGGFIAASYCPPYVTKINSSLEIEWVKEYEDVTLEGRVQDIEEISPDCIAVLFVSNYAVGERLKIAYLDKNGNLIETADLMKNVEPQDADIIPDGKGGFYLITSCDRTLAETFSLVFKKYQSRKESEVAVLKFSSDRKLVSANVFGGDGKDWVEEATLDNNGNIYIVIGTDNLEKDDFWQMEIGEHGYYRRMLIKLDSKCKVLYKSPLSSWGMAVDWNFGVHIKDNKAYVVGMSRYFDGYQNQYTCSQISKGDDGATAVYITCFDKNGVEQGRSIFNCDANTQPCDSAMMADGTITIAGLVSYNYNPFNLDIPQSVDFAAAIFVHKN